MTIYALFFCIAGQCRPAINNTTFQSSAPCHAAATQFSGRCKPDKDGYYRVGQYGYYVCIKRNVDVWGVAP